MFSNESHFAGTLVLFDSCYGGKVNFKTLPFDDRRCIELKRYSAPSSALLCHTMLYDVGC